MLTTDSFCFATYKLIEPSAADELNAITIKAINDVRAGKTDKASSVDDLLNQCLS